MVIPVPLASAVERHHEQVRAGLGRLDMIEDAVNDVNRRVAALQVGAGAGMDPGAGGCSAELRAARRAASEYVRGGVMAAATTSSDPKGGFTVEEVLAKILEQVAVPR